MNNLKQQRQGLINRIQDAGGRAAAPGLNQRLQEKEAMIRQQRQARPPMQPPQAPGQGFTPGQVADQFRPPMPSQVAEQFRPTPPGAMPRPAPQPPGAIPRPTPGGTNYQQPPPGFAGIDMPPPGGQQQYAQPMLSFQDQALDRAVSQRTQAMQAMDPAHRDRLIQQRQQQAGPAPAPQLAGPIPPRRVY